jgi:poly(hydroxyalkanoate) depolymerase family esterase
MRTAAAVIPGGRGRPAWGRAVSVILLVAVALAGAAPPAADVAFTRGVHEGRAYRLYLPRAQADGAPASVPLVLALHGCWQTPEDFAAGTRLNEAAERRGLAVLYPAQGKQGNLSRCWNWFAPTSRREGEAAELLRLAEAVRTAHHLREGVIVVGFSAGAFMAVNLVCVAPDVVRAVGAAAGGPFHCGVGALGGLQCMRGYHGTGEAAAAACQAAGGGGTRPLRVSLWHGGEDVVVNPSNLDALADMFARVAAAPHRSDESRSGVRRWVYRTPAGRSLVEAWLVPGMGHAWSGGDARGTHTFPAGPNATERMLDFLLGTE